jgi:hypothetical protein
MWGINNRLADDSGSETQPHPIDMNNNNNYFMTSECDTTPRYIGLPIRS